MDKQTIVESGSNLENKDLFIQNFKNELESLNHLDLDRLLKKLNFICLQLDPYNCSTLSIEEKNILEEFQLEVYLDNPFELTRYLLQMLNHVEIEIKKRLN